MRSSLIDSLSSLPLLPLLLPTAILLAVLLLKHALRDRLAPPFKTRSLLNQSETKLYHMVASALPSGTSLYPQVSYGEFLSCRSRGKFMSINAKRADMVICDPNMQVVAVIEYMGAGHLGRSSKQAQNARKRDAQKRRALKEAGVPLLEIPAHFTRETVAEALRQAFPLHQN